MIKKFLLIYLGLIGCFLSNSLAYAVQPADSAVPVAIDARLNSRETKQILAQAKVSKNDIRTYKKIFAAIDKNRITAAKEMIRKLDNKILAGHLWAQIYFSKSYKTTPQELQIWLNKYSDHPEAPRIYRLALQKTPAENITCSLPAPSSLRRFSAYGWNFADFEHLPPATQSFLEKQTNKFRQSINKGKTKAARLILENKQFYQQMPKKYYSSLASTLALKYFLDNENKLALVWADKSSSRYQDATALWVAGLVRWRLHQYQKAADKFSKLARLDNDEWLVSAGAYWAARSYAELKNKKQAQKWYQQAAKYKYTFYGILGASKLGITPDYQWNSLSFYNNTASADYIRSLTSNPAIKRALILIFCQEYRLAEQEIRNSPVPLTEQQKEALLFLAHKYRAHSLAIYLSKQLTSNDKNIAYDFFSYPIPHWQPQHGWRLDRSLILAIARQESSFMPKANSPAGAKGLLQLLPNTAYHITKDISLRRDCAPLLRAEYNLELGQQYVEYLLNKPFINGNLFYMLTAYNAGPGNLVKWQKSVKDENDPLMFIEVIPSKETRIYIERVMANYWIYQLRENQQPITLKQLSLDRWPVLYRE